MSFYNGCYRSFVPDNFIASMAYYAVVLLHTIHGPCSEVCALLTAVVACRPYICQVDRTIDGSSMPVSGRLCCGSEVHTLLAAAVACRPYPYQFDCIIVGSSMPVSGQLEIKTSPPPQWRVNHAGDLIVQRSGN
ncbi:hypothetical protein BHE74_00004081, partial [Ensete ventricosum]